MVGWVIELLGSWTLAVELREGLRTEVVETVTDGAPVWVEVAVGEGVSVGMGDEVNVAVWVGV